jgi:hypothetical protein
MQPSTLFLLALLVPAYAASANSTLARALGTEDACLACPYYYCWSSSACTSSYPSACVDAQISVTTEDCTAGALSTCNSCTNSGNVWCPDDAFCVTSAMYCTNTDAAISGASSCPAPSTLNGERGYVQTKYYATPACTGTAVYSVSMYVGCFPVDGSGGGYARAMCTSSSSAFLNRFSDSNCLQALGTTLPLSTTPWTCQSGAAGGSQATCLTGTYIKPRTGLVLSAVTTGTCPVASSRHHVFT